MSSGFFDNIKSFFSSLFGSGENKKNNGSVKPVRLSRSFTLTDDFNKQDPLFKEIMEERLGSYMSYKKDAA